MLRQQRHVPGPRALPRARRRLSRHPRRPAELPAVSQPSTSTGAYHPIKLPPFQADQVIDGYHFDMQAPPGPIHAIQAEFVHVNVTDPHGKPVHFVPWFGALAHAIFFQQGSLDYFHTHVCAPDAPNCGSAAGAAHDHRHARPPRARSRSACCCRSREPGGCSSSSSMHGHILTAPFTLDVA